MAHMVKCLPERIDSYFETSASLNNIAQRIDEFFPGIVVVLCQKLVMYYLGTSPFLNVDGPLEGKQVVWAHALMSRDCRIYGLKIHEIEGVNQLVEFCPQFICKPSGPGLHAITSSSCLGSAGIGVRPILVKEYSALRAGIFKA